MNYRHCNKEECPENFTLKGVRYGLCSSKEDSSQYPLFVRPDEECKFKLSYLEDNEEINLE